ncbi:hypothetical protein ACFQPG_07230 [Sphingomonas sp. GCM10030256]|uniref:hypothetical protein n=1 Tax=Sphingomonas sp. GCM10030256 TaxID=3273427 RepID=UPI0036219075
MQRPPPRAAGILIAVGALAGFISGLLLGDASWWVLVGTLAGATLAALLWLADRRH